MQHELRYVECPSVCAIVCHSVQRGETLDSKRGYIEKRETP